MNMSYKYITENNLENRQNYMYSEYKGTDFLQEYKESREQLMIVAGSDSVEEAAHITNKELADLFGKLQTEDEIELDDKKCMDAYTKTFEVRKRLYSEYNSEWKPVKNASREIYDNYILLAECLILMYEKSKCTKYISCLLKLDDTMISIKDKLTDRQVCELAGVCKREMEVIGQLYESMEVTGK